jgi:hypothetical protein
VLSTKQTQQAAAALVGLKRVCAEVGGQSTVLAWAADKLGDASLYPHRQRRDTARLLLAGHVRKRHNARRSSVVMPGAMICGVAVHRGEVCRAATPRSTYSRIAAHSVVTSMRTSSAGFWSLLPWVRWRVDGLGSGSSGERRDENSAGPQIQLVGYCQRHCAGACGSTSLPTER